MRNFCRFANKNVPQTVWLAGHPFISNKGLLYENLFFTDDVNALLQTVLSICSLNVLLNEHTVNGVNVNLTGLGCNACVVDVVNKFTLLVESESGFNAFHVFNLGCVDVTTLSEYCNFGCLG